MNLGFFFEFSETWNVNFLKNESEIFFRIFGNLEREFFKNESGFLDFRRLGTRIFKT